jgi:hypothetical protein
VLPIPLRMESAKYGVWLLWFGSAAAAAFGDGGVATAGQLVFWLTLLAHVAEFVVKRPLFERAGGSMGHHFVQTLIYGLFHWKPIQDRLDGAEGD